MTRQSAGHRGTAAGLVLSAFCLALLLGAGTPARAEFREVSLVDDEFEPANITIARGDTVVWIHRGQRPHGVRASDGSFESSPGCSFQNGGSCMRSGDRYSRTFDQPGTYSYFCPVHGSANGVGMAGQVTVASGGSGGGGTTTTTRATTTTTTRPTGTTSRPTTTAAAPPGSPTTAAPGATTIASAAPEGLPTTAPEAQIIVPPTSSAPLTSTSVVALPVENSDDSTDVTLLAIAAVVLLAALVGAGAWYYRPGARRPGGPPGGPPTGSPPAAPPF